MRPVNLLPPQYRSRVASEATGRRAYALLGALALLLVALTVYALTANQVTTRTEKAAEKNNAAQEAEQRAARLAPFSNFAQVKQVRAASVRALASSRFDWERLMRELSKVLPRGTWLTAADAGTAVAAPAGGGAAVAPAGGGPSAKLSGCAGKQTDVARLIIRLRQMHGVDDVTLTSSEKSEDSGGAATASSSGSGGSSDTGCAGRYQFEVVVAFEAPAAGPAATDTKPVPSSLGGGG